MTEGISSTGRALARDHRDTLGRIGLTAKGVLYLVLGLLAIQFARGQTASDEVSQTGAIQQLADQPFGKFLLIALTIGLVALTLWHVIQAVEGDPVEGDEGTDRIKYAAKAVIYAALTFTSITITVDNWNGGGEQTGGGSGDETNQRAANTLFDLPAGRLLVVVLGLVLLAIAGYQVVQYVIKAEHMKRISGDSTSIELFGRIGYGARAVVVGLSGVFFLVAAAQHDPNESKGISGALQSLADHGAGRIVLWLVAVGLALFGVFCFAEAKQRPAA